MQNAILSEKTHRFAMKRVQKTQKIQIENVKNRPLVSTKPQVKYVATVIVSSIFGICEFICY